MQHNLLNYPNLDVRSGSVFDLVLNHTVPPAYPPNSSRNVWATIGGIRLGSFLPPRVSVPCPLIHLTDTGEVIKCTQVILCTGTFLSGEIHIGMLAGYTYDATFLCKNTCALQA
jgi:tRNA uridine 5-carboxymethylaminomethyl modification enzyme